MKHSLKHETSDEYTIRSLETSSNENPITRILMSQVESVAEDSGAKAIFILCNSHLCHVLPRQLQMTKRKLFYVLKRSTSMTVPKNVMTIEIPDIRLTRMGQMKLAIFLSLVHHLVGIGDVVVCLTGPADGDVLDTLFISHIGNDPEMFSFLPAYEQLPGTILPEVVARVMDIATQLGAEGREGKPVGALFVIGDSAQVLGRSWPLILNPFFGYKENQRNLLDPRIEETIKEFSSIDGAFIVREDGVVESSGTFLKVSADSVGDLQSGLGSRHHVAAGITAVTESLAVAVSESTGTVSVFCHGKIVTKIEKPRRLAFNT